MRHEAAHFLSGYLCGLPIKSYKADGGTTLVEFYDSAEGDMAGRALKFTAEEVDQVRRGSALRSSASACLPACAWRNVTALVLIFVSLHPASFVSLPACALSVELPNSARCLCPKRAM